MFHETDVMENCQKTLSIFLIIKYVAFSIQTIIFNNLKPYTL